MQLNAVASNGIKIAYETSATALMMGLGKVAARCSAMAASRTLPPPRDAPRGQVEGTEE